MERYNAYDKVNLIEEENFQIEVTETYNSKLDKILEKRMKNCYCYMNIFFKFNELKGDRTKNGIIRTKAVLSPIELKEELKRKYHSLFIQSIKKGLFIVIYKITLTNQKFKTIER